MSVPLGAPRYTADPPTRQCGSGVFHADPRTLHQASIADSGQPPTKPLDRGNLGPLSDYEEKIEKVLRAIALPDEESRLGVCDSFPDVDFFDEEGERVRLLEAVPGPRLLVFFRGFW